MSTKHTPGPWHLSRSGHYVRKTPPGIDTMDWNICTMNEQRENYENDARLIAATPELLEALKEIEKGEGAYKRDQLQHAESVIENMKSIARAAIARAEGNEQK